MEILELKNTSTIFKIKNSVSGLNIRMEGIEERISELPHRTIECTQSEQKINKIMNRASGICVTITKDITLVLSGLQKERAQKVCKEVMAENVPNSRGPCPKLLKRAV